MPTLANVLPSSLIFLLILALWAGYLVHHWVQRRDHVATARTYDRYSEAMRVLELRGQRESFTATNSRSYGESPMRPVRPTISAAASSPIPSASLARPSRATAKKQGLLVSSPQQRAVALFVSALFMVVSAVLAVVSVWSWWALAAGVGLFVASIALIRSSVKKARAVRIASRRAAPSPAPHRERTQSQPQSQPQSKPAPRKAASVVGGAAAAMASQSEIEPAAEPAPRVVAERPAARPAPVSAPAARREASLYDLEEVERVERPAAVEVKPAEVPAAGTWIPVPVPVPTYTMKAKAGTTAMRSTTPEPMPTNGLDMAFDEEEEELPAVQNWS
ncbi:hypothetical protein K0651_02910 [Ornithinimicrobium sp. Arc0846-15]|nr:hypothetical protein [Ornithinimicrobium laminariae]